MNKSKYEDLYNMERPVSKRHTPMPLENRAAQFAPFAALTGYDDAVEESARITKPKIELSEEKKAELDITISEISSRLDQNPKVKITYFVPDAIKTGGEYVTAFGTIKKIDPYYRRLVLTDKTVISIDEILSIEII